MQNSIDEQAVIACNLDAIDSESRDEHMLTAEQMLASIVETKENPDGYAFRFPNETAMLNHVVKWIANERLCCPFFTFKMIVNDEFWLELSGNAEVKAFIHAIFIKGDN